MNLVLCFSRFNGTSNKKIEVSAIKEPVSITFPLLVVNTEIKMSAVCNFNNIVLLGFLYSVLRNSYSESYYFEVKVNWNYLKYIRKVYGALCPINNICPTNDSSIRRKEYVNGCCTGNVIEIQAMHVSYTLHVFGQNYGFPIFLFRLFFYNILKTNKKKYPLF